ncbi:hypothetical protein O9G_000228 [Rozella allomycis CSF55]|uniref:Uncharacterized protein n=1 Tax=Rozella allomycis (strain CSF55) TaxID=988480 RepID=A0A075AP59_ROZAC|nr:hypothetical protein O9G_000228 [Rozella allomycis CSF55]|eukprot:EPZ31749.1 hypothetical protein O9G_000228 [Rozella allomycis CSF55]
MECETKLTENLQMMKFEDHFWGENLEGYQILHNKGEASTIYSLIIFEFWLKKNRARHLRESRLALITLVQRRTSKRVTVGIQEL